MPTKRKTANQRQQSETYIVRQNRIRCFSHDAEAEEMHQLLSLEMENCDFSVASYSQALKSSYLSHTLVHYSCP